ncbi:DUF11 domain-containing protein [Novipirellula aureliae]|nr:DUF11 domain-containing protein [Novipirellula aureliae]
MKITLAACFLLVMATGCQMPMQKTQPVASNYREPTALAAGSENTDQQTMAPEASAYGSGSEAVSSSDPIAQVGCIEPVDETTVGYSASCGDISSTGGDVGCESETFSVGDGCGPPCEACSQTACPTTPHGYAAPLPVNPNVYGIDPNEFICNGGDQAPQVFLKRNERLAGLNLQDTVVHYTTEAGDIDIQESNPTCLYAPRFASVRKITGARSGGRTIGLAGVDRPVGPNRVQYEQPNLTVSDTTELARAEVAHRVDAMRDRNRGVRVENVLQPVVAEDVLAVLVGLSALELNQLQENQLALLQEAASAAVSWTIDESVEVAIEDLKAPTLTRDQRVEELTVYDFPDAGRLQIVKLADRKHAQPGERVTFAIRVENIGDSAVHDVTLTDNLTTRLEYIDGSQTCSGGAIFASESNDGDSLTLQWKLTDELKVGESVTIRFQCRVR